MSAWQTGESQGLAKDQRRRNEAWRMSTAVSLVQAIVRERCEAWRHEDPADMWYVILLIGGTSPRTI